MQGCKWFLALLLAVDSFEFYVLGFSLVWRDMSAIAWIWLFMVPVPIATRSHRTLEA
jgi:hypothetical protein